jgi:nicotinic acid phosphoribosyltransferase
MIIEKITEYKLILDPGEQIAVATALWSVRHDSGQPWDWVDATLARLGKGDPLPAEDARALQADLIAYMRARYPGQQWPADLDDIAAQLQAVIP